MGKCESEKLPKDRRENERPAQARQADESMEPWPVTPVAFRSRKQQHALPSLLEHISNLVLGSPTGKSTFYREAKARTR